MCKLLFVLQSEFSDPRVQAMSVRLKGFRCPFAFWGGGWRSWGAMQRSALSEGFLHRGLLAMLSPNGLIGMLG